MAAHARAHMHASTHAKGDGLQTTHLKVIKTPKQETQVDNLNCCIRIQQVRSLFPLKSAQAAWLLLKKEWRQFVSMINIKGVGGRAYVLALCNPAIKGALSGRCCGFVSC